MCILFEFKLSGLKSVATEHDLVYLQFYSLTFQFVVLSSSAKSMQVSVLIWSSSTKCERKSDNKSADSLKIIIIISIDN